MKPTTQKVGCQVSLFSLLWKHHFLQMKILSISRTNAGVWAPPVPFVALLFLVFPSRWNFRPPSGEAFHNRALGFLCCHGPSLCQTTSYSQLCSLAYRLIFPTTPWCRRTHGVLGPLTRLPFASVALHFMQWLVSPDTFLSISSLRNSYHLSTR